MPGYAETLGSVREPQPSEELGRASRANLACLPCRIVRQWGLGADSPLTPRGRRRMRVGILGPFHLEDGGRQITISGVRQRAVLAGLLLHANQVVPSEQLLVDLWGEDSPPSAANALQAAISRLRRALPAARLMTKAPGYLVRIFPEELDVSQFEQLVSEGREALTAGDPAQAAQTLRRALSLWRGPALADFRYEPFAQAEIARLEELHMTCLEERIEADLVLGLASVLVPELRR